MAKAGLIDLTNSGRRWRMCAVACFFVVLSSQQRTVWAATLAASLVGLGSSYWKVRVIGRIHMASGEWEEVDFGHFLKMASRPLELLEGYDRKNGVEHLQKCRDLLVKEGWQELPRGQHWYSWRFQRPAQ